MNRVLVLRPQPAAEETAARARARGLRPIVAPLFEIRPLAWEMPAPCDALLLTSANAARHAGMLPDLPCYAVGPATAEAARAAGLRTVIEGRDDGAAALALATADGHRRILHLCGREHLPIEQDGVEMVRRFVYAAEAAAELPAAARQAIADGAVVLLHSPRAARTFAALAERRQEIRVAAISPAAAAAAGSGWAAIASASEPRDQALLEVAAQLCKAAAAQDGDR
ncbi:uroporphyrinogen III synthase HEM4 [Sphingomonas parva]|uniref:Uroporphyrinogen III synthase HEM4 n=1 Tax=Sphingomonas parva TaxID=2555898 RepID=A0A4Y8ZW06_9SPHN|nr:uroporphyrinogen-III synthase [Sphingomonas parva]TFI59512.1 uroporphyrinogen III synthase HEM4 [Sphingomonas parva]